MKRGTSIAFNLFDQKLKQILRFVLYWLYFVFFIILEGTISKKKAGMSL